MIEWVLVLFLIIRLWMIFLTSKVITKQLAGIRLYRGNGDGLDDERFDYMLISIMLLALHVFLAVIDVIEIVTPGHMFIHEIPVYAGINVFITSLLTWRIYRWYK